MFPPISLKILPYMKAYSLKAAIAEARRFQRKNLYAIVESVKTDDDEAFLVLQSIRDHHGSSADIREDWETANVLCKESEWSGQVASIDPVNRRICVKVNKPGRLVPGDTVAVALKDYLYALGNWADSLPEGPLDLFSSLPKAALNPSVAVPLGKSGSRPSQELAVANSDRPLMLLWGPPGTGKTYTLGRIIAEQWAKGRTVSAVSISHVAVDQLALAVDRAMREMGWRPEQGVVVRYNPRVKKTTDDLPSHLTSTTPDILEINKRLYYLKKRQEELGHELVNAEITEARSNAILSELASINMEVIGLEDRLKTAQANMIKHASVVLSTINAYISNPLLHSRPYNATVVDEASMVPLASVARLASDARDRFIFAGDFCQLGPICQGTSSATKIWFENSVFEAFEADFKQKRDALERDGYLSILREQSRMHPTICRFISEVFYDGRLSTLGDHRFEPALVGWPTHPVLIDDPIHFAAEGTSNSPQRSGKSWQWDRSARCIAERVGMALQLGSDVQVAVVTPFASQAQLLQTLLGKYQTNRLVVGTIHRMQGKEADIVFFDPVNLLSPFLQGNSALRLINVAISRAKKQVIVVAPYADILRNPILRKLVPYAQPPIGSA